MIRVGQMNTLDVHRQVRGGWELCDEDDRVFLPEEQAPWDLVVGVEVEVFVYTDGQHERIATTQRPLGMVGDFGGGLIWPFRQLVLEEEQDARAAHDEGIMPRGRGPTKAQTAEGAWRPWRVPRARSSSATASRTAFLCTPQRGASRASSGLSPVIRCRT